MIVASIEISVVTFYKAIVIRPDIFGSEIVNEKHFSTPEEAERYKKEIISSDTGLLCIVCQM